MTLSYGFDQSFVKYFLTLDRDHTEAQSYLSYIQKWQNEKIDTSLTVHKTFAYIIEKFSYGKKIFDVISLLKLCDQFLLPTDKQEVL